MQDGRIGQGGQIRPGNAHVVQRRSGLPFAFAGLAVGLGAAAKAVVGLPALAGAAIGCEAQEISLAGFRAGFIPTLIGGIVAVVLCEVAARRDMGRLRILTAIGSTLGVFAAVASTAALAVTLLGDATTNCLFGT